MPEIYGIEHILYLIVVFSMMAIAFILIRKKVKTETGLDRTIRITGGLLLACIVWNRLSIAWLRDGWDSLIPGSFCGLTSLVFSLATLIFRKNSPVFHCLVYCGLLGGTLTLAYPDFIGQADSIWYPMTISGLAHHTVMLFLAILMIRTGWMKPELKKWPILPIGLSFYMSFGLFLITYLGYGDAIHIYTPILEDTPLDWLILGILFLGLVAIFLFVWDRLEKKQRIHYPVYQE
jgi:hypothetical protein